MDEISKLLKEAKPLYFARKRRNNRIKAALCMVVCVLGLGLYYPKQIPYEDYFWFDEMSYLTEGDSYVESMGLPTDEYGLLKVV